ncbi:MAG: hypothetical protein WC668_01025 [Patescibacteria group bacterium]|jgi:hypothetical protein
MPWWKKEKEAKVNPAVSVHPADRQKNRPPKPVEPEKEKKPPKPAVKPSKSKTIEEIVKEKLTVKDLEKYSQLGVPFFELTLFYRTMNQVPKPENLETDARVLTESCRDQGYDFEDITPRELLGIFVDWFRHNRTQAQIGKPLASLPFIVVMRHADKAVRRELGMSPNIFPKNQLDFNRRLQEKMDVIIVMAKCNKAKKLGLTLEQLLAQEATRPDADREGLKKIYTLAQKLAGMGLLKPDKQQQP